MGTILIGNGSWFAGGTPSVAPIVTTISLTSATVSVAYNFTLAATGATPITWTLQSGTLPTGLTLSSSGLISGTPTVEATTTGLVFRATNSVGFADSGSLSLAVVAAGSGPTIVTTSFPATTAYNYISYPLEASGSLPITWEIVGGTPPAPLTDNNPYADRVFWRGGGLPSGLALDKFSGQIVGSTGPTATPASFSIKATNANGSYTQALALSVTDVDTGVPVFKVISLPKYRIGHSWYIYNDGEVTGTYLHASGSTLNRVWSVTSGSLPTGLQLEASTGRVLNINGGGQPTAGVYNFTATVTTAAGSASQAYSLTVIAGNSDIPAISSRSTPDSARLGLFYDRNYMVCSPRDGATLSPVTWSLTGGSLPSGLTLSSAGVVTGTPSSTATVGTYYFKVRATNTTGFDEAWIRMLVSAPTAPLVNQIRPALVVWQGRRT